MIPQKFIKFIDTFKESGSFLKYMVFILFRCFIGNFRRYFLKLGNIEKLTSKILDTIQNIKNTAPECLENFSSNLSETFSNF